MPQATLSSLGARVLRKLGVQIVSVSQNNASPSTMTHQQVATLALRKSGVQIVPSSQQGPSATIVSSASIAQQALRQMGALVVPVSTMTSSGAIVASTAIASGALRKLGVQIVSPTVQAIGGSTVGVNDIATRALRKLGAQIVPANVAAVSTVTFDSSVLAGRAVREFGIVVPQASWSPPSAASNHQQVAALALRAVGMNPVAEVDNASGAPAVVTVAQIAADVLRSLGVNPFGPITGDDASVIDVSALSTLVLERLEVIDPAEAPNAADLSFVEAQFTSLTESLVRSGVASWTATTAPGRTTNAHALMLTYLCASTFGKQVDVSIYQDGEQSLRVQALSGDDGQALAQAAVNAVHDSLAARNIVSWPSSAIPSSALNSYVSLTASMLVPTYAQIPSSSTYVSGAATRAQVVANEDTASQHAEETLRRISLSGAYGQSIAEARVQAVHDYLVSLGLVSWQLDTIPAAAVDDYVTMASVQLWPVMSAGPRDAPSRQIDQSAWNAAEDRLRKAAKINGALALAEARIADVQAELAADGLASWQLTAIPQSVADAVVDMTVQSMQPLFDGKFDPDAFALAKTRVRSVAMGGAVGVALAQQKVTAIHEEIVADGLASWTIDTIPLAASEAYVEATTQALMTSFDQKPDPDAYAAAIRRVRMIVMGGTAAVALAQERLGAIHEEAAANGLVSWTIDTIPLAAAAPYLDATAEALAPAFDGKMDPDAYAAAIKRIRLVAMGGAAAQALAQSKVASIHDEAAANGLVSWTVDTIPQSAAEPYRDATVQALATSFEQKPDLERYAAAVKRIRDIAMGGAAAQALAEQKVISTHEEATANGLTSWLVDAIPLSAVEPYVDATMQQLAPAFDRKPDPAAYDAAVKRVRMIAMGGAAGQALAQQKVMAVHAQLDVEGAIRWTIYDVPDYAEEPYVLMAAVLLAPEWERPFDPKWATTGRSMIDRAVSLRSAGERQMVEYF